jgi:hypothetical protein
MGDIPLISPGDIGLRTERVNRNIGKTGLLVMRYDITVKAIQG